MGVAVEIVKKMANMGVNGNVGVGIGCCVKVLEFLVTRK